jgi:hypothetical protein
MQFGSWINARWAHVVTVTMLNPIQLKYFYCFQLYVKHYDFALF